MEEPVPLQGWLRFMTIFLMRAREASSNMFIINPTTPAQYFHALRRQVHRPFSSPLVVLSPKMLHHHTPCSSPLDHLLSGQQFECVISDGSAGDNMPLVELCPDAQVRRLVVCSGKIFYDVWRARQRQEDPKDIVIVRLEQLFPFPYFELVSSLRRYPNAEVVWLQEEPKNMGAWAFVEPRFRTMWRELLGDQGQERLSYVGRTAAAAPGGGSWGAHISEQKEIVALAIGDAPLTSYGRARNIF